MSYQWKSDSPYTAYLEVSSKGMGEVLLPILNGSRTYVWAVYLYGINGTILPTPVDNGLVKSLEEGRKAVEETFDSIDNLW